MERLLKVKYMVNIQEGGKTKQNIKTEKSNMQKTNSICRKDFYMHRAKIACF